MSETDNPFIISIDQVGYMVMLLKVLTSLSITFAGIVFITHFFFWYFLRAESNRVTLRLIVFAVTISIIRGLFRFVLISIAHTTLACRVGFFFVSVFDIISPACLSMVGVHTVIVLILKAQNPRRLEIYYYIAMFAYTVPPVIVITTLIRTSYGESLQMHCWASIYLTKKSYQQAEWLALSVLNLVPVIVAFICMVTLLVRYFMERNNFVATAVQYAPNINNHVRPIASAVFLRVDPVKQFRLVVIRSALYTFVAVIFFMALAGSHFVFQFFAFTSCMNSCQGMFMSLLYFSDPMVWGAIDYFLKFLRRVYVDEYKPFYLLDDHHHQRPSYYPPDQGEDGQAGREFIRLQSPWYSLHDTLTHTGYYQESIDQSPRSPSWIKRTSRQFKRRFSQSHRTPQSHRTVNPYACPALAKFMHFFLTRICRLQPTRSDVNRSDSHSTMSFVLYDEMRLRPSSRFESQTSWFNAIDFASMKPTKHTLGLPPSPQPPEDEDDSVHPFASPSVVLTPSDALQRPPLALIHPHTPYRPGIHRSTTKSRKRSSCASPTTDNQDPHFLMLPHHHAQPNIHQEQLLPGTERPPSPSFLPRVNTYLSFAKRKLSIIDATKSPSPPVSIMSNHSPDMAPPERRRHNSIRIATPTPPIIRPGKRRASLSTSPLSRMSMRKGSQISVHSDLLLPPAVSLTSSPDPDEPRPSTTSPSSLSARMKRKTKKMKKKKRQGDSLFSASIFFSSNHTSLASTSAAGSTTSTAPLSSASSSPTSSPTSSMRSLNSSRRSTDPILFSQTSKELLRRNDTSGYRALPLPPFMDRCRGALPTLVFHPMLPPPSQTDATVPDHLRHRKRNVKTRSLILLMDPGSTIDDNVDMVTMKPTDSSHTNAPLTHEGRLLLMDLDPDLSVDRPLSELSADSLCLGLTMVVHIENSWSPECLVALLCPNATRSPPPTISAKRLFVAMSKWDKEYAGSRWFVPE
ncbi:hypothetical protein DM01DRAFT_1405972 [Hesseltinella vesiculosa]|uniref:G-protein coupled receptors family 2 profile 2 domain-containing protein n=1 Tax=Hesseltinella vesiculosa TaxID=101127 RepID=A0A1X2GMQ2_9FUNG|nr:hypothetical protein DM01DRAFT_1405972 [Hesseltinella vesiculosa]